MEEGRRRLRQSSSSVIIPQLERRRTTNYCCFPVSLSQISQKSVVIFAWIVTLYNYYCIMYVLWPTASASTNSFITILFILLPLAILNTVITVFCLYVHYRAACTNPGTLSLFYAGKEEQADSFLEDSDSEEESSTESIWCDECENWKPSVDTQHCYDCNVCVIECDHHCVWIGNCIGIRNHKIFLQYLVLVILQSLLNLLTLTIIVALAVLNNLSIGFNKHQAPGSKSRLCLALAAFCLVFVSMMLGMQLYSLKTHERWKKTASIIMPDNLNPTFNNLQLLCGGFNLLRTSRNLNVVHWWNYVSVILCRKPTALELTSEEIELWIYFK